MGGSEQQIQAGRTPLGLWWSQIAGFAAWAVDLGFSYVLEQHSCSTGHHYVLHVISIVCLAIALTGFGTGWVEFKRFPGTTSEEGGSHFDRAHFQALLGMAFSLSFAVMVIAGSVPRWILGPCE
ncbi:MAG: hypothetical protein DMG82_17795 [Acidobacteria bacterium]|nr:MAG: hypothetical protein DMG82_17795 [Acidobacteriota bacterium]PYX44805.1 MAG: hypothetical protein DMG83_11970 [Acidobacteriota bacterium]